MRPPGRRRRRRADRAVQAQIVGAALHVGRGERHAERVAQRRDVLEVDLLLEVLGAGGDQHALAAEDRGDEIGERLAGAGAGFGEQRRRRPRTTRRRAAAISTWPARGSKSGSARASAPPRREDAGDAARAGRRAVRSRVPGYSGNFRHSASTSARTMPSARSSSGVFSARVISSPMTSISGFAHAARRDRRRADADAARDHRRILIERDRVLVDRDAGLAERRLGHLAGDALREDVDQHQVIVGAAADQAEAGGRQRRGEPLRVGDDLLLVVARTPAPPLP